MNRRKHLLALVLVCVLALTACTPATSPDSGGATTAPAATTAAAVPATPEPTPEPEEPGEFTMFYQEAGQNFPEGFKHDDNEFLNYICELANVRITELIVPAYSDTGTKFNLMMSSGNIPDLVERLAAAAMKEYGAQGAFLPTEDIIRGSAVMSAFYDDTQLQAMQSADGVAYVIINPPVNTNYDTLWVRKDLLDELGLPIPTTIEEMTQAARQLKAKYPDSIPFAGPGFAWRSYWMIAPFNTNFTGWQYFPETGQVENVFAGDNIVKSVTWVRELYQEGLLDQEFLTTNADDDDQKKVSKNVLFYFSNSGSGALWIQRLYAVGLNNAQIIPMRTPMAEGVGVDEYYKTPGVLGSYVFGINAKTKALEPIVRFLEVLYCDEVRILSTYGREGIEYRIENGQYIPIQPAATQNSWRTLYGWMFINSAESMEFGRAAVILGNDALDDKAKQDYIDLHIKQDADIKSIIYNKVGYNPLGLAQPIPDDQLGRVAGAYEEQKALYAKAMMGEITIEEFIIQKDALVAKYQDVTDAYNVVVEEAKVRYGL